MPEKDEGDATKALNAKTLNTLEKELARTNKLRGGAHVKQKEDKQGPLKLPRTAVLIKTYASAGGETFNDWTKTDAAMKFGRGSVNYLGNVWNGTTVILDEAHNLSRKHPLETNLANIGMKLHSAEDLRFLAFTATPISEEGPLEGRMTLRDYMKDPTVSYYGSRKKYPVVNRATGVETIGLIDQSTYAVVRPVTLESYAAVSYAWIDIGQVESARARNGIPALRNTIRELLRKALGSPSQASDTDLGIARWAEALDNENWKRTVKECKTIDELRDFLSQRNMLTDGERNAIAEKQRDTVLQALIDASDDIGALRKTIRELLRKALGSTAEASDDALGIARWAEALDNRNWKQTVTEWQNIDGLRDFLSVSAKLNDDERSAIRNKQREAVLNALIDGCSADSLLEDYASSFRHALLPSSAGTSSKKTQFQELIEQVEKESGPRADLDQVRRLKLRLPKFVQAAEDIAANVLLPSERNASEHSRRDKSKCPLWPESQQYLRKSLVLVKRKHVALFEAVLKFVLKKNKFPESGKIARLEDLDSFNSSECNLRGEAFPILIAASEDASESITFKTVRRLYLLETPRKWGTLVQRLGRVNRYRSHLELPSSEQTTEAYVYMAKYAQRYIKSLKARLLFSALVRDARRPKESLEKEQRAQHIDESFRNCDRSSRRLDRKDHRQEIIAEFRATYEKKCFARTLAMDRRRNGVKLPLIQARTIDEGNRESVQKAMVEVERKLEELRQQAIDKGLYDQ